MSKPTLDLLAIGNAIVDVIAQASDQFLDGEQLAKGSMQLIDAERAEELYGLMGPARELSGGSAANTVAGLATLGHRCAFVGQVAADQLGQVFAHDIRATGVDYETPPIAQGPPTARSLILVTPDGQRTMNTYLGASQLLDVAVIAPSKVASARSIFLEGYLWDPWQARQAMRKAVEVAKAAGREVILTLSDASLVERHRDDFLDLLKNDQVDLLFANKLEALALSGETTIEAAISQIRQLMPLLVVTDGENGAYCLRGNDAFKASADRTVEVVDTTGAGDAFAAGFLSGHLRSLPLQTALEMGTICASEAISHYGPRPETDLAKLMSDKLGLVAFKVLQ
jgi:sugar/nucleoside kinase (ribokinase family)